MIGVLNGNIATDRLVLKIGERRISPLGVENPYAETQFVSAKASLDRLASGKTISGRGKTNFETAGEAKPAKRATIS
jgi:hypothetical protein